MKYVGFEMPEECLDDYEWLYDVNGDKANTKFYVVDAKNATKAREKVFEELYNNKWGKGDRERAAIHRAWHVLEDLQENEVIKEYGEHDGQIIIKVSSDYLDLDEKEQEKCDPYDKSINELIKQLSETTTYRLAFEEWECDIGIAKAEIIKQRRSSENLKRKYIGFKIPNMNCEGCDWAYDVIEANVEDTKFYIVDAENTAEARKKVFKEIYDNDWGQYDREIKATLRAWRVLENLEESEVVKKYGEHDGQIIIKVSSEYLDLDEKAQEACLPYHPLINQQLSETAMYELAFEFYEYDIGVAEVEKTL